MSNLLQHHYVISLNSAKARREHIIQEFGKQEIPFEFFDAITPDLIEAKAAEFGIDISNSALTKGEIACALSHIAIWHLAKQKQLNYVCVFEDDIYLGKDAAKFLTNKYIANDVDVVKLEKNFNIVEVNKKKVASYSGRELYKLRATHAGTAGYLITNKGANYLINSLKTLDSIEIDNIMFNVLLSNPEYCVWQIFPAICIQSDFQTTILGRDERNQKLKRKLNFFQKVHKEILRNWRKIRQKYFGKIITFE